MKCQNEKRKIKEWEKIEDNERVKKEGRKCFS